MMFSYFFLMNGTFIVLNAYVYPVVMRMPFEAEASEEPLIWSIVAQAVLFIVVSLLAIELAFKNPGYLQQEDEYN